MKNPVVRYLIENHFLAALIVVGLLWLAMELSNVIIIVFISYIIMAGLSPFADFLTRKRIPRIFSALIAYVIALAVLFLLIFPLIPFFASQIELLFKNFPKYIDQLSRALNLHIDSSGIQNVFESDISAISKNALSVTGKIFSGFFTTFTVLVISFYLTLQNEALKKQFIALFPKNNQENVLNTISQIEDKIGWWLRGQITLSFAIGFFTWAGLSLLGLPFALPLGLLAGILEIVPTVGPIVSAIPAVIVALSISPGLAISTVLFYILLQMLENHILVPKIMQKAVGLNPIVVIIGVLIGSKFLGVLGALLAVPFISMLLIIIKSLTPKRP